jgi:hypothetical protein
MERDGTQLAGTTERLEESPMHEMTGPVEHDTRARESRRRSAVMVAGLVLAAGAGLTLASVSSVGYSAPKFTASSGTECDVMRCGTNHNQVLL